MSREASFTPIELFTVMAIIGILAAILIPVVGAARERARTGIFQSNLRSWHSAISLFSNDHVDQIPKGYYEGSQSMDTYWSVRLTYYMDYEGIWKRQSPTILGTVAECPSDPKTDTTSWLQLRRRHK